MPSGFAPDGGAASPRRDPAAPCRGIRFVLDGRVVEVDDAAPSTTLLDYLRESLGRTGTKEGCAEGDCGACTVVLGELRGERVVYRAINACIRLLATVDGCEVVTVESLRGPDGALHPVQQAMVDEHASQCGFCTPGFVMSLLALYLADAAPARETVLDALAGNLCRCTGYRPIVAAAARMNAYPAPARWSRADARDPARAAALRALAPSIADGRALVEGFESPRDLDDFARRYEENPYLLLVAGATDVGLRVTKQLEDLGPILHLGRVQALATLRDDDGALEIGAAVSLTDAFAALVAHYPSLAELANRFASPPIRHSGTLCGNVANGSPIGDSMPILVALGATLLLRRGARTREVPLDAFYVGYRRNVLERGEFVAAVRVPPAPRTMAGTERHVAAYKVAKRFDQDISSVSAGFVVDVRDGAVVAARLAYGGMAATPKRAAALEAAITGRPWTHASLRDALPALSGDFAPIDDFRASASYRLRVAGHLLLRLHAQSVGAGDDVRIPTGPLGLGGA